MAGWWAETFASLNARLQAARANMSGQQPSTGTLAVTARRATAALIGAQPFHGAISAVAQPPRAALSGAMTPEGVLAVQLRAALFSGTGPAAGAGGTLAATAQAAQAILTGQQAQQGALAAVARPATAVLAGGQSQAGSMAAVARPAIAALAGSQPVPVAFDALGGGNSMAAAAGPLTWSHTAAGGGGVLVFVGHANNAGNSNLTVTYGGTPMNRLGSAVLYATQFGFSYWVSVFGLLNPPSGARTVSITPAVASYVRANSVSYTGVTAFGTPVTKTGTVASAGQQVTLNDVVSAGGRRVAQMFHCAFSSTPFTAYTQSERWSTVNGGGWSVALTIGDAPGSADVDFAANWGGGTNGSYGGIAVDLIS